jgi:hypothetical protein
MSFYYSSELSVSITNLELVVQTKERLIQEHLGKFYKPEMASNFELIFEVFKQVSDI